MRKSYFLYWGAATKNCFLETALTFSDSHCALCLTWVYLVLGFFWLLVVGLVLCFEAGRGCVLLRGQYFFFVGLGFFGGSSPDLTKQHTEIHKHP